MKNIAKAKSKKYINMISKLIDNNSIVILGTKYQVEHIGEMIITVKGKRNATYLITPCLNATIRENDSLVFSIGNRNKSDFFTILNNATLPLYI